MWLLNCQGGMFEYKFCQPPSKIASEGPAPFPKPQLKNRCLNPYATLLSYQ